MKTHYYKWLLSIIIIAAFIFSSTESYSQTRKLPDGSIVYPDGTRKLPNGTVIYKNGTLKRSNNSKQVIYRDSRRVEQRRKRIEIERRNNNNNHKRIPPGQAKKIYGGNARDYAPGHQKKRGKNGKWSKNYKEDHDAGKGGHKGKHKDKDD